MSNASIEGVDVALFDIRIVERNIAAGKISREQYQAYLDSLEDSEAHGEPTETRFVHKFGLDDEDDKDKKKRRR